MRFSVSQSSLLKALSIVSKGISTQTTLVICGGILLKAYQGTLELQTTDLDTSVRHKIAANVEEEGETVVSRKVLSNIVKNLSDAAITFDGGNSSITITSEKSSFHLKTLNPSEFSPFPEIAWERSVELPCAVLSKMVDKVYKAVSRDTSRPIYQGIFLNVEENTVRLVATDSYRLAVCDTSTETSSLTEPFELIIPGTVFHDALSLISENESIIIGNTNNQIIFVSGNTTYISRRIEGSYPQYKRLLPPSCTTSVKFKVNELEGALKRVNSIATENVLLDIDIEGSQVTLSSSSQNEGDAKEVVSVEATGKNYSFATNSRYLNDCLTSVDDNSEITFELSDASKAGIFKSYSKINFLYLLMPVRM